MKRTLGTCYYPEHWPRDIWLDDAKRMAAAGLTWVRIGEFAWSRLEPQEGNYQFEWLDEAIQILGDQGLKVVLGTPTATPPRWMMDKHPDMLALDVNGRPRKFGSRRHYCFSHEGYAQECDKIVRKLAERYGQNQFVAAWQTDNEYGCHDTTISYSDAARVAFQNYLRARYRKEGAGSNEEGALDEHRLRGEGDALHEGHSLDERGETGEPDIQRLNDAWGNVFWSMIYDDFDQIDLPNLTVTEANPAHSLAFRQFSSHQVVRFNRRQVEIIRSFSKAPISHNYMGRITDFDHFAVGEDLDFATWDSYPLGFLADRVGASDARKAKFMRQGDPDFQAFHHDLYRAVGRGRWWVMEQQPGPVNWAPYNPEPAAGMVRLWSWEAFAHGAEAVCYFRWRQAPFAQEQLHAGLLRPDSENAPAMAEAMQVAKEIAEAPEVGQSAAKVALIFDYEADAAWTVQPHGVDEFGAPLSYFGLAFDVYRALRSMGLSVDIVPPSCQDYSAYQLVLAPGAITMPRTQMNALYRSDATLVFGPRTAARTPNMTIPNPLPPHIDGLDVTVTRLDSFRADMPLGLENESRERAGKIEYYREILEGDAPAIFSAEDGQMAIVRQGNRLYVGAMLDMDGWRSVIEPLCAELGLDVIHLPDGVRLRETATERFWFNFTQDAHKVAGTALDPISMLREPK